MEFVAKEENILNKFKVLKFWKHFNKKPLLSHNVQTILPREGQEKIPWRRRRQNPGLPYPTRGHIKSHQLTLYA